jgi:hypothetical protein
MAQAPPRPSSSDLPARFIDALRRLEQDGDVEALVALYASDAVAGNVLRVDGYEGPDGARELWSAHRHQLGTVTSTFDNVVEGDGVAALEWSSTGTVDGRSVADRGVTVLEVDGDALRRTCASFDPTALA